MSGVPARWWQRNLDPAVAKHFKEVNSRFKKLGL
jgi:hypothetical protein